MVLICHVKYWIVTYGLIFNWIALESHVTYLKLWNMLQGISPLLLTSPMKFST